MVVVGAAVAECSPYPRGVHIRAGRHDEALRFSCRHTPNGATAPFLSEFWLAGILETFGGTLLLLGLFTRPVAFLLSGEMAVAYFQFSFPVSFWPILNNGVPPALYCFLWLYFSAAGPGPWSLDAIRGKRRLQWEN